MNPGQVIAREATKNISAALDMGLLEKATIFILDEEKKHSALYKPIKVQFNPQSYSLRKGVRLSSMQPVPQADEVTSFVSITPENSFLMVQLVFDSYTEYGLGQSPAIQLGNVLGSMVTNQIGKGIDKLLGNDETVHPDTLDASRKFIDLIRIDGSRHEVKYISFVWGPMNFIGTVSGLNVEYTMFARDGTPVRTTVGLIIAGDEARNIEANDKRTALKKMETQAANPQEAAKTFRSWI